MKRQYDLNPLAVGIHNSTLYEPQRTNHFEVHIFLPESVSKDNITLEKYITLATTDFSLPNISTTPIEIPYGNTKIKIAGNIEYGGADSLSCTDFIGADIEGILYAWQYLVINPETAQVGWSNTYKTDATVIEYSPDGACLASWVLRGVFPQAISYGDSLSKGDSSVKKVNVTLSYDAAYRKKSDSNRNTHASAAVNAATNMAWKPTNKYETDNLGGPIRPMSDNL